MGTKEDREEKYRMLASISFVAVLIVVGVPLWWKTTEVYRVTLPYDRIASLDKLDIRIVTNLTIVANDDATAAEIRDMVTEHFSKSEVLNVQVETRTLDPNLQHAIDEEPDESTAAAMVSRQLDLSLGPDHLALVQRPRLYNKLWIGNERVLFFKNNLGAQSLVSALSLVVWQESALEGARAARAADVSRRRRAPPAASYRVALAVLNPDPLAHRVDLDAHHIAHKYLQPFLEELRELHNYTLTTQWLYLLELDVGNKQVQDDSPFKRHFAVSENRLSHLLTALESRLASPGTRETTLHLVLYAPLCERAPLHIYRDNMERAGGEVDAFLSARWGGLTVSNPSHEECASVLRGEATTARHAPHPRHLAGVLLLQLRQLLGINEPEWLEDVRVLPLTSVSPRRWELDALLRIRTLEQLVSAKLTLTSLSQLLGEISNIVINDAVGASVQTAVASAESASRALRMGDLRQAFRDSQRAFLAAEAAFTDPSLLALLYFPDDQKYAVYIPLFLPVMIPVFLSLDNIYKWLRSKPGKEKSD